MCICGRLSGWQTAAVALGKYLEALPLFQTLDQAPTFIIPFNHYKNCRRPPFTDEKMGGAQRHKNCPMAQLGSNRLKDMGPGSTIHTFKGNLSEYRK